MPRRDRRERRGQGDATGKTRAAGNQALGAKRLALMDKTGVDVQALAIDGFWWYQAERDLASRVDRAGTRTREVGVRPPGSVRCMAWVTLRRTELAARQLLDGVKRLGLHGASIGGHVNGEDLSLPKYGYLLGQGRRARRPGSHAPGGADDVARNGTLRGHGNIGTSSAIPRNHVLFTRLISMGPSTSYRLSCVRGTPRWLPAVISGPPGSRVRRRGNANCANKRKPSE